MEISLIEILDQIENCTTDMGLASSNKVIEVMLEISQDYDDIKYVIDRYSQSHKPIYPQTIAFILARKADDRTIEIGDLILHFLDKINNRISQQNAETLENSFTAIRLLSWYGGPTLWHESPSSLVEFLIQAFKYDGRLQDLIKEDAFDTLSNLLGHGWLDYVLTQQTISELREGILKIQSIGTDIPEQRILETINILDNLSVAK